MRLERRQGKVFYGWWIAGVCASIQLYMGGVVAYGFTAIFKPIANEFNWSYAQVSFAASLRGMEMSILAPIMGLLVDRFGPRRIVFTGVFICGLGLILLSYTKNLGMFYGAFVLIAIGMSSSSTTVIFTAVANWFRKKVAMATGIAASGAALAGLMVPLVTVLVDTFGWRLAMLSLGLGMWVIPLPLSLLFRHKPEQYGYLPDGDTADTVIDNSGIIAQRDRDIRIKQVIASRSFWHLTIAFMCLISSYSSVITHLMPYLSSIGMARSTSSWVVTAFPLASIFGRLGAGWFGDRFDNKRITFACFISVALGLLAFNFVAIGRIWLLVLFLMFFSIGIGSSITIRAALAREYYGSSRFGTVYGIMTGITMLGMIAGPPIIGWLYDKWGSYQNSWLLFVILVIVAIVTLATTPQIDRTTHSRN